MDTIAPNSDAGLAQIGGLIQSGQKHEALEGLRAIIAARPLLGEGWMRVVQLTRALGDYEAALEAVDYWIAARPDDPGRREVRIETLERMARTDAALNEAIALSDTPGGETSGLYHQGICLARHAKKDESIPVLKRILDLDPTKTAVWDYISAQKKFVAGDEDIARLEADYQRLQNGDPNILAPIVHSLGKAYDDIGDVDRAFEKLTEVGQIMRRFKPFDVSGPVKYCGRLANTFTRSFFEQTKVPSCDDATPVFVIGPPRSGTTLLEQMLSTHPAIFTGGEHTLLRMATYRLKNFEPFELRDAYGANQNVFADCGRTYVERIKRRFGAHARITDKTLINHFFVGVLHMALPNAKIIWARRDNRDTAWSCFKTRLQGNRWTEDINDIVTYVKAYDRLMSHWKDMMGDDLLVVDYETLTDRPNDIMQAIFSHIGVDDHDGWRNFHKADSAVATASLGQVRSPLNRKSVGAWHKYEKYLAEPFRAFDA